MTQEPDFFAGFYNLFDMTYGAETALIDKKGKHLLVTLRADGTTMYLKGDATAGNSRCIYVKEESGVMCLATNYTDDKAHSHEVFASGWLHLGEQLEDVGSPLFPAELAALMRQVGGDAECAGYYRIAM